MPTWTSTSRFWARVDWTKRGAGTLTLAGPASSNSSSSPVTIQQGRVRTAGANTLSASSAIAVAGGASLDLDGNSQIVASLAGEGEVMLGAGTLTTGSGSSTHFAGTISGAGGRLVKSGSSILRLSGVNTYSGGTALKRRAPGSRGATRARRPARWQWIPGTTLGLAADDLVLPNDIGLHRRGRSGDRHRRRYRHAGWRRSPARAISPSWAAARSCSPARTPMPAALTVSAGTPARRRGRCLQRGFRAQRRRGRDARPRRPQPAHRGAEQQRTVSLVGAVPGTDARPSTARMRATTARCAWARPWATAAARATGWC